MIDSYKVKYNYPTYHVNKVNDMRYYCISSDINVPSVTSILKRTNNSRMMPTKVNNDSLEIGNIMHKYLDIYVSQNKDFYKDSKNFLIAKGLAQTVIDNLILSIDEIWGTEVSVLYKDAYAGTIDLIGTIDGKLTLIDYKSSYRRKRKNEMDEYFLQLAAYSIAHDWQYDTTIDSIIVFLAIRNGQFEKTVVENDEFDYYKSMWFDRLNAFLQE